MGDRWVKQRCLLLLIKSRWTCITRLTFRVQNKEPWVGYWFSLPQTACPIRSVQTRSLETSCLHEIFDTLKSFFRLLFRSAQPFLHHFGHNFCVTQPFVYANIIGTSGAGHCIWAWCSDAIQLGKYSQVLWHNDRVRSLTGCVWKTWLD